MKTNDQEVKDVQPTLQFSRVRIELTRSEVGGAILPKKHFTVRLGHAELTLLCQKKRPKLLTIQHGDC